MESLIAAMEGQPGDLLLFAADKNKIVWNVLGALRLHLAEELGLLDKNEFRFVWITEFPLLEWSDEENRFGHASSLYHAYGGGTGTRSIPIPAASGPRPTTLS